MSKRTKLIVATGVVVLAVGAGAYAFKAASQEGGFGPRFMHRMGPGSIDHGLTGSGRMGAGANSATAAEMDPIHGLLDNHDRIRRTVVNLPDGIRTVTESDDPQIAQTIKDHVAGMRQRVGTGQMMGLPIESPALRAIYRSKDKIRTTVEITDKGSIVVQTSSDPDTVAVLQKHAAEVSDLVRGGMQALHMAVMKNGGMPMHGEGMHEAMHGRMMRGMPNGHGEPDAR
jgi:hypothetical protein